MHRYDYNHVKLNLGSGNRILPGFLNLDIQPASGVDIICDLNEGIPLNDNTVTEIYTSHTLEHLNDIVQIMEEIFRVCKDGAIVKIKVPYFKSIGAFKDPTHKRFFTEETFAYFDKEEQIKHGFADYGIIANFKTVKIAYLWSSSRLRFLPFKKKFFMKYFWNIVRSIYFELLVVKKSNNENHDSLDTEVL